MPEERENKRGKKPSMVTKEMKKERTRETRTLFNHSLSAWRFIETYTTRSQFPLLGAG